MKKLLIIPVVVISFCASAQLQDSTKVQLQDSVRKIDDRVFIGVEHPAQPAEGFAKYYKYLDRNLRNPANAAGKVFVQFIVNRDGSLSDFKVIKGLDARSNIEAIKIIQNGPKWTPAQQGGVIVRRSYQFPVHFK